VTKEDLIMKSGKRFTQWLPVLALPLGFAVVAAHAQVSVRTPGQEVRVGGGGDVNVRADGVTSIATGGNEASVNVGGIGSGVDVQGVAVINGKVYIDNKEVPPGVTRYKSPRSGTVYLIQRKASGVTVTSEGDGK
jgi:hypothetical protein